MTTGQPLYWQWLADKDDVLVHVSNRRLAFIDRAGNSTDTGFGTDGVFQAPALSPNGRYLAYQDVVDEQRLLVVRDLEAERILWSQPHEGIAAMSWSPDGMRLAYTRPESEGSFFGPLGIFDVSSENAQILLNDRVLSFFWSPDSTRLAYFVPSGGEQQAKKDGLRRSKPGLQELSLSLGVIAAPSGGRRSLLDFRPNVLFVGQFLPFFDQYALSHRIWSPDSRFIVVPTIDDDGEAHISVVPIDGRPATELVNGLAAFWSFR